MPTPRQNEFVAVALGHLSSIYNAARRMTRSEHDAQDLAQETYVEAFRHASQLRDLAHCKAWLFRILRNRFISDRRKERARPELVVVDGGLEAAGGDCAAETMPQLERTLTARLTRAAIVRALGQLPDDLRTALLLCDVEGFTYEQIAEIMDSPLGTVRSRIARARARLARQLAPQAAALGIGQEPPR